jgi:hypothetical protein
MNQDIQITHYREREAPPLCATCISLSKPFIFIVLSDTFSFVPGVPLALYFRFFLSKWHKLARHWHTFCCATYSILSKQFTYKKGQVAQVAQGVPSYTVGG